MAFAPQDNYTLPLPKSVGKKVGVRGYLLRYADCSPLTLILSLQGEKRFSAELGAK